MTRKMSEIYMQALLSARDKAWDADTRSMAEAEVYESLSVRIAERLLELLREKRDSLSKTQSDVADDIGVKDFTSLSHWENGRRLS